MKGATTRRVRMTSVAGETARRDPRSDRAQRLIFRSTSTLINHAVTSGGDRGRRTAFPDETLPRGTLLRANDEISRRVSHTWPLCRCCGIVITTARIDGAFLFAALPISFLSPVFHFSSLSLLLLTRSRGSASSSRIPYFSDVSYEPMRTVVNAGRTLIFPGR